MLKIIDNPTYLTAVTVAMGVEQIEFDVEFAWHSHAEYIEIIDELRAGQLSDENFLRRVVRGWRRVIDTDGLAVPFDDATMLRVLGRRGITEAVVRAWVAINPETPRQGNSAPPSPGTMVDGENEK